MYFFMRGAIFLLLCLFVSTAQAEDEAWTLDQGKEHPPTAAENRIIKWCATNGNGVRYASANIQIAGYQPCGEMKTPVTCDPTGKRFISASVAAPSNAYKDCSLGNRIQIVRHDPLPKIDSDANGEVAPLSSRERNALANDYRDAQKKQERDPEMQIEKALDSLMKNLLSSAGASSFKKGGGRGVLPAYGISQSDLDKLQQALQP